MFEITKEADHETGLCSPEYVSSSYDDIASMYDTLWADWYLPAAMPALEKLLFSRIPVHKRILDVCCGSGHVTKEFVRRGYDVTGIDASAALIRLAKRKCPSVKFHVQDARQLGLRRCFDAAVSTFDSLNHILTVEDLGQIFRGVHDVLAPGSLFVFDMNLEEAYLTNLREWHATVDKESVGLVRGAYDPLTRRASTELVWFARNGKSELWKESRSVVEQQCYRQAEITLALAGAGFTRIEALTAQEAGMRADLGLGRMFFAAYAQE